MFDIPVRIEGVEKRRKSIRLFHILSGFFLAVNAGLFSRHFNYSNLWALLPVYLMAAISLVYGIFRKRIDSVQKYSLTIRLLQFFTFLVFAVIVLNTGNSVRSISLFLWAGICLALFFSERVISRQPVVYFHEEGVSAPGSFSTKMIKWDVLDSVVVRPDYITLNYSTNQYLQFEVLDTLTGTEIERINLFCRERIENKKGQQEGNLNERDNPLNI